MPSSDRHLPYPQGQQHGDDRADQHRNPGRDAKHREQDQQNDNRDQRHQPGDEQIPRRIEDLGEHLRSPACREPRAGCVQSRLPRFHCAAFPAACGRDARKAPGRLFVPPHLRRLPAQINAIATYRNVTGIGDWPCWPTLATRYRESCERWIVRCDGPSGAFKRGCRATSKCGQVLLASRSRARCANSAAPAAIIGREKIMMMLRYSIGATDGGGGAGDDCRGRGGVRRIQISGLGWPMGAAARRRHPMGSDQAGRASASRRR